MRLTSSLAFVFFALSIHPASALPLPLPQYPATIVDPAQSTCTSAEKDCERTGGTPTGCAKANAACLQTGTFVGPTSGRRFGPLKKQ